MSSLEDKDNQNSMVMETKKALLEAKLRKKISTPPQTEAIVPNQHIKVAPPLSFAQQRLWMVEQLHPGNIAYNVCGSIQLKGLLDISALERSLNEIIRRHESLRTTFNLFKENPIQYISPANDTLSLSVLDLSIFSIAEREAKLQSLLLSRTQQPFDLTVGPLFLAQLIRLDAEEHVLPILMHHSITDGWSLGIINHEMSMLYEAFTNHRSSPLPELSIQYADYAVWQRNWLQGSMLTKQLDYWCQQLAGVPAVLELSSDYPRPAIQTFRGSTLSFSLPVALTDQIYALSHREKTTPFMTLLTAFYVLLARYSGQKDLLVGTPIAGRANVETEKLIGFFVNTLALRANLSDELTLRELLHRVRKTCLDAYDHQDLPFERIVKELQPERNLSYNPLVQIFFALQNAPMEVKTAANVLFNLQEIKNETSPFDLFFELVETSAGSIKVLCTYSTDIFAVGRIERLVRHYQRLLEGIVENPEQGIWTLPLLTPQEHQQLLIDWNMTQQTFPRERCIHQLFEEQVVQTPETVSVVYKDQHLTYVELDRRANQLAHYLRRMGVGPEVLVGLYVERSLEMVVGLLGILKAGGAYVPLDPGYPSERLAYMLEDSKVAILLTSKKLSQTLSLQNLQILLLDEEWQKVEQELTTHLPIMTTADNLAYIIYTSGSTGTPKGVAIEHHSVVRLVKNTNFADLSARQIFLQFAPITFDAATLEIWGPLLNGGQLVVFPTEKASLDEIGNFIQKAHITTLWLTAGLFHQMVEEQIPMLQSVQQIITGGDVLSVKNVKRATQEIPHCKIINGYGPTENTTFTTCYTVPSSQLLILLYQLEGPSQTHRYIYSMNIYNQSLLVYLANYIQVVKDWREVISTNQS